MVVQKAVCSQSEFKKDSRASDDDRRIVPIMQNLKSMRSRNFEQFKSIQLHIWQIGIQTNLYQSITRI